MKDQAKVDQINAVFNTIVPKFLNDLTPYLRGKGRFLLGDRLFLCDFWIGMLYVNFFTKKGIYEPEKWKALLNRYPLFQQYGEAFAQENRSYLAKRTIYP